VTASSTDGLLLAYTETDPVWLSEKGDYLTSALAGTTYLATGTAASTYFTIAGADASNTAWLVDTDSWPASSSEYYTLLEIDGFGYLTSESDPIWVASSTNWANWNTAYDDRLKWDGGSTGLTPATGRTSLELGDSAVLASSTWVKTETDPVWTIDKSGYLTTSTAVSTYVARSDWTTIDNYPSACTGNNWAKGIGDTLTCNQIGFSNLSGSAIDSQIPDDITITDNATTGVATLSSLISIGTIGTGVWEGTAIGNTWIASSTEFVAGYDHSLLTSGNPHSVTATNVGLGSVENTAISTWGGSTNLLTVGTIGTGIWQGTAIADAYVADNITLTNITQITNRDLANMQGTLALASTTGTLTYDRGGTGTSTALATGYLWMGLDGAGNLIQMASSTLAGGGGADTDWIINGTDMYATTTITQVGINDSTPTYSLDVYGDLQVASTSVPLTAWNLTDGTSNQVAIFKANERATAVDNDQGYLSFYGDDSEGDSVEFGRLTWEMDDVTTSTKDSTLRFYTMTDNVMNSGMTLAGDNLSISGSIWAFGSIDSSEEISANTYLTAGSYLTVGEYASVSGELTVSGTSTLATTTILTLNVTESFNADTATALASNPTDCGAGTVARSIDASGNLTCSAVDISADTNLTGGRSVTISGDSVVADAELYVFKAKIAFENPVATDDFFFGEIATAVTFTSIYCKTLVGTVDLDVQIAGSDINGTDITCNTTGVLDDSLGGDTAGAVGEELKLAITSVASAPTYLFLQINGSYND